jgi:hypothetical protein
MHVKELTLDGSVAQVFGPPGFGGVAQEAFLPRMASVGSLHGGLSLGKNLPMAGGHHGARTPPREIAPHNEARGSEALSGLVPARRSVAPARLGLVRQCE